MKSLSFADKLNLRLNVDSTIEEDFDVLMDLSGSLRTFKSQEELKSHLSEGSLLNINRIASKALSVPCGEYMVWTTDAGTTMLVPTSETRPTQEVYEDRGDSYEVLTPELMRNWNTVERVLAEDENTPPPPKGDDDDGQGPISSKIKMSSVDRTPIVRAMEQHGHTVTSLAQACGVDTPAISRILRTPKDTQGDPGGRNPSIGLAAKIANELKMDAEALFPDIFGVPKTDLQARDQPGNRGSGMSGAAHGSMRKGKATKMWTQGNS